MACSINPYALGGTINGLTTDGLVLVNGTTGGTILVTKGATSFTFGLPVKYGVSYGATILTQPTGQTCTLQNGTGVMGDANVSNLVVNCA